MTQGRTQSLYGGLQHLQLRKVPWITSSKWWAFGSPMFIPAMSTRTTLWLPLIAHRPVQDMTVVDSMWVVVWICPLRLVTWWMGGARVDKWIESHFFLYNREALTQHIWLKLPITVSNFSSYLLLHFLYLCKYRSAHHLLLYHRMCDHFNCDLSDIMVMSFSLIYNL